MFNLMLVHWNETEAAERVARMESAGFRATVFDSNASSGVVKLMKEHAPDAVVIDLGRLPSHGRSVAFVLRQSKATRHLPLIFVNGANEKVERIRADFPDAAYTAWGRIRSAVQKAIRNPPLRTHVPVSTSGYAGTPLPKKLGVRPGTRVLLVGAPAKFRAWFGKMLRSGTTAIADVQMTTRAGRGNAELALIFAKSETELAARLETSLRAMAERGKIWIAWPKQTSGVKASLGQAGVRRIGLAAGLVDFKVCAIDEVWSGQQFARRRG